MNPASSTSTDQSLELKLKNQAEGLVKSFRTRLKQLLKDEAAKQRSRAESVATVEEVTWKHLSRLFDDERFKEASNLVEEHDNTKKALFKLIGEQADLVRFTEPGPSK